MLPFARRDEVSRAGPGRRWSEAFVGRTNVPALGTDRRRAWTEGNRYLQDSRSLPHPPRILVKRSWPFPWDRDEMRSIVKPKRCYRVPAGPGRLWSEAFIRTYTRSYLMCNRGLVRDFRAKVVLGTNPIRLKSPNRIPPQSCTFGVVAIPPESDRQVCPRERSPSRQRCV